MKVKCNNCGKIVNEKESMLKELGIDENDFRSIYICSKCRKKPTSFTDKFDWATISRLKLSEQFIEKYKDKVDWNRISECQELSEKFIEKYKDKVNWYYISKHQKLSTEFIIKHMDKITEYIFDNPCYRSYPDSVKLLLEQKFNK